MAKCTCALRLQGENRAVIYGDKRRITVDSPWFCNWEVRVQLDGQDKPESHPVQTDRDLYVYEIESFASELRGRPIGAREVGMRFDDTLGNMKALDWWRAEIGLAYEGDRKTL